MKALLDACANVVPGMHAFEVELAKPGYDCTYDVVLYSVFDSLAALEAYQNHPQHVALKPFVVLCALKGSAWITKSIKVKLKLKIVTEAKCTRLNNYSISVDALR